MKTVTPLWFVITLILAFCRAEAQTPVWEVGAEAPEVEGYDELGNLHKLSDARGKYVFFEVGAAWCYPSFVLAKKMEAVKQRLQENGVELQFFTVIYQDPVETEYPLRSQALAWKEAYPSTDVVLAYHKGLTNFVQQIPAARTLFRINKSFPTVAIVGPDGIVKKILVDGADLTADELLAEFLPDQPPLEPIADPVLRLDLVGVDLKIKVGDKTGFSHNPFFSIDSGFAIPSVQRGDFSAKYSLGVNKRPAPCQQTTALFFDTTGTGISDGVNLPSDKPIEFHLRGLQWKGECGVLSRPEAEVSLYDNFLPAARMRTPVSYRNGHVVVGPFKAGSGYYPYRYVVVNVAWVVNDPRLVAAFGSDETARLFGLNDADRAILVAEWRAIELALDKEKPEPKVALRRIAALREDFLGLPKGSLTPEQQRFFVGTLDRMRIQVRQSAK